jgi:hypothetical protein
MDLWLIVKRKGTEHCEQQRRKQQSLEQEPRQELYQNRYFQQYYFCTEEEFVEL